MDLRMPFATGYCAVLAWRGLSLVDVILLSSIGASGTKRPCMWGVLCASYVSGAAVPGRLASPVTNILNWFSFGITSLARWGV
jgi:hypothetical protein